jgi:succinoglycan biosynthesis protein ExoM
MHISICVCTYQRPAWLKRLLDDLKKQRTDGLFTYEVVLTDNDAAESGRPVVIEAAATSAIPIIYTTEPRRSIAHARNTGLAQAKGQAVAFIDDDEFPGPDWLLNLFQTWTKYKVAGVLAPVRPLFEAGAPDWVKKGGFYDRPEHETGYVMPWTECRTGNVLFDREIIRDLNPVFSPEFGTGGSDVDFFRRMIGAGRKFIWCNEAPVMEIVPPSRWDRGVLIKRALLRGRNSFRHPKGRWLNLVKAVLAIPLYVLVLPVLLLAGQHHFMKFVIKLCNHIGRLLALFGISPVKERAM